ncbi:unnamed protein product [Alternaria alternata]
MTFAWAAFPSTFLDASRHPACIVLRQRKDALQGVNTEHYNLYEQVHVPQLTASLNSLGPLAWVKLSEEQVCFTIIPEQGTQVWAVLSIDSIFESISVQSAADNVINLEVPLASLNRALKSAFNATSAQIRLTKKDNLPVLALTVTTTPSSNTYSAFPTTSTNEDDDDDEYGDDDDDGFDAAFDNEFGGGNRETIITQEIPIRVLAPDTVAHLHEPVCREPDVHIVLPPLMQLKSISDRFTKLALADTTKASSATTAARTRLDVSANMHGCLKISIRSDAMNISSIWTDLSNPELDPGHVAGGEDGVAEHPSTRMKQLGSADGRSEEGWATVRIDGRDWGKVMSVGRLGGRVIACFCHEHALILYVYLPNDNGEDESVLTARCTSHALIHHADIHSRHRDAQLKYGVASDIDPATIPTLLRSAFGYGDPILAWHVRSLEVWYDRRGWDMWKTLDFETPVDQSMQSPIAWEFIPGEIDDYLERLEQGQGRLLPRRIDEARTQILDGHDTYLKALLIVHCPRLRDAKFVLPARHEVETCSCLGWLDTFINDSHNKKTSWGPGLQNLQSAAVGLPSGTWMDDAFHPNTEPLNGIGILVQFLRLPHLERLYYKDLEGNRDDEVPWDVLVPAGTCSIKHLFLDNCGELDNEPLNALVAAPSALQTACFRAGDALLEHADQWVSCLGTYQGQSLESLMFYGYGSNGSIHGYRCGAFRPEELNDHRALKHVCMDISDFELEALYNIKNDREEWESDGALAERTFFECVQQYEVIVLWGSLGNFYVQWEPTEEQGFEDAVIAALGPESCTLAMYLEDVEKHSANLSGIKSPSQPMEKDKIWFRRAIETARKRGVDLHTLTNRNKPIHQIEFPEAPDKYDLKTGPWGERPEDWVFNVYTGRREPQGCGKCGDCDVCFGYYSKEMWDGLKKEPRKILYDGKNEDGTSGW